MADRSTIHHQPSQAMNSISVCITISISMSHQDLVRGCVCLCCFRDCFSDVWCSLCSVYELNLFLIRSVFYTVFVCFVWLLYSLRFHPHFSLLIWFLLLCHMPPSPHMYAWCNGSLYILLSLCVRVPKEKNTYAPDCEHVQQQFSIYTLLNWKSYKCQNSHHHPTNKKKIHMTYIFHSNQENL